MDRPLQVYRSVPATLSRQIAILPMRLVAEYRWLVCVGAGCALYVALPSGWGGSGRAAASWIATVIAFLGWTVFIVGGARPERLRELARRQDIKSWIIFILAILAAVASLIAASVLLRKQSNEALADMTVRIFLVTGVVLSAWLLTHTMFAVHYAHGFYGD